MLEHFITISVVLTFQHGFGTITVLSSGGGGGGSAILYDLYGTNTTSNNVFLNLLSPSVGTTDQIEFAGGGRTSVQWDSANDRATINTPAPALTALTVYVTSLLVLTDW